MTGPSPNSRQRSTRPEASDPGLESTIVHGFPKETQLRGSFTDGLDKVTPPAWDRGYILAGCGGIASSRARKARVADRVCSPPGFTTLASCRGHTPQAATCQAELHDPSVTRHEAPRFSFFPLPSRLPGFYPSTFATYLATHLSRHRKAGAGGRPSAPSAVQQSRDDAHRRRVRSWHKLWHGR